MCHLKDVTAKILRRIAEHRFAVSVVKKASVHPKRQPGQRPQHDGGNAGPFHADNLVSRWREPKEVTQRL
jgi:hypothetical protein